MTKNKIKTIIMVVAILLCLILAGGWIAQTFITSKHTNGQPEIEGTETNYSGNLILTEDESKGNGIALMSVVVAMEDYADYGISAQAENAYTLTATVRPDNTAENTGVDWAIKWKNASSSWANGKAVKDYVTITPSGEGYAASKTVTVANLQAFGEQIIVTATARDNPEVTANCSVDYVQKVTNFSLSFGTVNCNFGGTTGVTVELNNNGSPIGGAAKLNKTTSQVYSLADTFNVSYSITPVDTPFLFKDWTGMSDYWMDFGYATEQYNRTDLETVKAKLDRSALVNYNVAQKGLYFGIKYFRNNLGLNGYYRYYRAGGVYSFPMDESSFEGNFSPSSMIESYTRIKSGGTYNDGYFNYTYSGLDLFKLTVKIEGAHSSMEKTTTFTMNGYTNTSPINAMEVSSSSVMF